MIYDLTASVHKGSCSSAHLAHNRRTIAVPHSNEERRLLNVCYKDMSLEDAYHLLFDRALEKYNADKKPSRQISDYLKHITEQYEKGEQKLQEAKSRGASTKELARIKSRYPKPFYELIVSVGNSDAYQGAFMCGGDNEQTVVDVLNDYMADFQERNPHLFVFSAHLHRDENGVPHIHIDYIPWTSLDGRSLPIRVSENGAFRQQGLSSGEFGDIGTIAFQNQERQTLSEIAKKHGINIIEGKHSKKHLSKEEYVLHQEQEKAKSDRKLVNSQAEELIQYQDELVSYLNKNGIEEAFAEHIENISLKRDVADYEKQKKKSQQVLATCWDDYNNFTSSFFDLYRENKNLLWEEIKRAREKSYSSKKRLADLIYDITNNSDFFIVKIFKLFVALALTVDNIRYDNEVERLQEANRKLKDQARDIMSQSKEISAVLRTRQLDAIEQTLTEYEIALENAKNLIADTTKGFDFNTDYVMCK